MDSSTVAAARKDHSGTTLQRSQVNHASDLKDSTSDSGYSTASNQAFTTGDIHVNPPSSTIYETTSSHHSLRPKVEISSEASESIHLSPEAKEAAENLLHVQRHPVVFQTESQKLSTQQRPLPNLAISDRAPHTPNPSTSTKGTRKASKLLADVAEKDKPATAKTPATIARKMAKVIKHVRAGKPKTSATKHHKASKTSTTKVNKASNTSTTKNTKASKASKKSTTKGNKVSKPAKKPTKPSKLEDGNLLYEQGVRCNHEGHEPCNLTSLTKGVVTKSPFRKAISNYFGRNRKCTKDIPESFWVMVCRKHYQQTTYRAKNGGNIVKYKLIKILAEVKLIDELCKNRTVWKIQLKKQKAAPPMTETDPAKAAENAKQEAALANVIGNLHKCGLIGGKRTTEQVVASLKLIGSEYCVGLKRMLDTIQFLPSGMPDKADAPKKPLYPIKYYLTEAEDDLDWLETPEQAARDEEDAHMDAQEEEAADGAQQSEGDVENEEITKAPTPVSDDEMECEE